MRALCVSYEGTEEVVQAEIKKILSSHSSEISIEKAAVIFEVKSREDIFKLAYLGQSFMHVIELFDFFTLNDIDDFSDMKSDFSGIKDKKFKVSCLRLGSHNFSSQDVERELGSVILDKVSAKVDLHNPEIIIFVYIYQDKAYIGFDHIGLDLSKRDYNVYPHSSSIKGPLAFAMLNFAEYSSRKTLLDPFCLSGTIPIEAAFYSTGFPINYFRKSKFLFFRHGMVDELFFKSLDKEIPKKKLEIYGMDYNFPNGTASKHNAKMAELDKVIDFRRGDTRWLDLKFEEGSVDCIVTAPQRPRGQNITSLKKRIDEFFINAKEVLKKSGVIVILENGLIANAAEKHGLNLAENKEIRKGNSTANILIYKVNNDKIKVK